MASRLVLALSAFLFLASCDPLAQVQSIVPSDEDEFARRHLSLLAAKEFAAVEAMMNPEFVNAERRNTLIEMAYWFPEDPPQEVLLVSYSAINANGVHRSSLYYQYHFPEFWMMAEMVLEGQGSNLRVAGLHFYKSDQSWIELNEVRLAGKSILHLAFLAATVFNPLLIVFALVQCIRTPIPRRKWLWIIFILVGITNIQFNWTTGEIGFSLLHVSLMAAAFAKLSPISPLILNVGVPLGAILFLVKRRKWLTPPPADAPVSA